MAPEDDEADSDEGEEARVLDLRPESDSDDDDAYEFLPDDDDPPIGAVGKGFNFTLTEKSPFLQLDMGGYTLHPRLRSLTVTQGCNSIDILNFGPTTWAQNWAKFWDNFSTMTLQVLTCIKTQNMTWARF